MISCKYHSRQPSCWVCPGCHTQFCAICIPGGDDNFKRGQPRCLLCSESLQFIDHQAVDAPFWQLSNRFFAYPFDPLMLFFVVAIGVVANGHGTIAALIFLLLNFLVLRYSLASIRTIAHDDWQPPSFNHAMAETRGLVLKLILLVATFSGGGFLLMNFSETAGWVLLAFGLLALPAAIMVLAMSDSFLSAVNPFLLIKMMRIFGWPYLLVWFAYTAITSAPEVAYALSPTGMSGDVLAFFVGALGAYSCFVTAAMMGYVLYQHRDQLGIEIRGRRGRLLDPGDYIVKQALGSSHVYIQEHKYDDAFKVVRTALNANDANLELNRRLFQLVLIKGSDKKLLVAAGEFIRLLFAQGQQREATEVWRQMSGRIPGYLPEDADLRLMLGSELARQNRWKDAKAVLLNLHKTDPRFEGLGEAYLVLALVYLEGFGDRSNAAKLQDYVAQQHPDALEGEAGQALADALQSAGDSVG